MRNLLEETISIIAKNGKNLEEINWIGSKDGYIDKELFFKLANVEYYPGFGASEVATDLLIVADNWWLERHEYDGSEWWEFKTSPLKPKIQLNPIRLTGGQWTSLKQMENEDNY